MVVSASDIESNLVALSSRASPMVPTSAAARVKASGSRNRASIWAPLRPNSSMARLVRSAGSWIEENARLSSWSWAAADMRLRASVLIPSFCRAPAVLCPSSLTPARAFWNRAIIGPTASAPMPAFWKACESITSSLTLAPVDAARSANLPPKSRAFFMPSNTAWKLAMVERTATKAPISPAVAA